jgi:GntR family transcriptional regulator
MTSYTSHSLINKSSGVPLHVQLANILREQVLNRQLQPEDRLPSERELCEMYGISRITVRQALNTLTQEGLVYSTAGKGTFIAGSALDEELQPLSSFTQDMERRGMQATSQVLNQHIFSADDFWANRLKIPRGAEVVHLHRLRLGDGLPVSIQHTYLSHHLCPDLLAIDFSTRSLYEVLRHEYSYHLTHSDTVIEAALAEPEEAHLLILQMPAAVLISEQSTYLDTGTIIEITRSIFNADRYKLHSHA